MLRFKILDNYQQQGYQNNARNNKRDIIFKLRKMVTDKITGKYQAANPKQRT